MVGKLERLAHPTTIRLVRPLRLAIYPTIDLARKRKFGSGSSSSYSRTMPADPPDKKPEKSYLSSAVDSINPWASSRTSTPTAESKRNEPPPPPPSSNDHSVTPLYGRSFRTYPADCPPLNVQWFHAVDVPKRKPRLIKTAPSAPKDSKPPSPKKFTPFSTSDSRRLESRYQKLLEAAEEQRPTQRKGAALRNPPGGRSEPAGESDSTAKNGVRVPVNEDFLFQVDIEERELAPVYWMGPVYEVRRGTWFFQEGSNLRACEENLAAQLEEGFLKMKPWLLPAPSKSQTNSQNAAGDAAQKDDASKSATETSSAATPSQPTPQPQPQPHRLFGAYMSNEVTYQDANIAWLSTDGVLSWVTTTMYERFAGGGYMSGVKLVRGYTEPNKTKDKEDTSREQSDQDLPGLDEREKKSRKRKSAPPASKGSDDDSTRHRRSVSHDTESRKAKVERQLSFIDTEGKDAAGVEEQIRQRDEQEIQDDYNDPAGETQGREIEHLVLVTHGIGQRLGLRLESINFVHDVNVLRKTLKSVYAGSADLKALNSELDAESGNCRVQVLPVCWRHLIEFPRQRQRKAECDLGDLDGQEDRYPSLEDITIEGVAFARSLISDLALDVLLYQSSYRDEISRVVVAETNRILRLFREQNPEFKGKVHLMGHSLGSAIFFDVLCRQQKQVRVQKNPLRIWPSQDRPAPKTRDEELQFEFPVHDYFCLGSPVGLFQMLQGRTIAARDLSRGLSSSNPFRSVEAAEAFLATPAALGTDSGIASDGLSPPVSSPMVEQLFNIFHPSDPVSYRLEPLISPAMGVLKPQLLPYTKRGLFSNVTPQGLTGIGARVGQSVSGLWSSLSAGIASNLLNRSLGLTNEELARMAAGDAAQRQQSSGDDAAGRADERKKQLADPAASTSASGAAGTGDGGQYQATLIDDELETLFSAFERSRAAKNGGGGGGGGDDDATKVSDEGRKARKLRAEELKVRALNRTGRVDFSIQEGALDFNPINTIASHMSYWADEDVNHFVLSQLLSAREGRKSLSNALNPDGAGAAGVGDVAGGSGKNEGGGIGGGTGGKSQGAVLKDGAEHLKGL